MGLLGGAASEMQKSYKQNRSLGNKKKSLKERSEHFQGVKKGKKLEFGIIALNHVQIDHGVAVAYREVDAFPGGCHELLEMGQGNGG